MDLVASAFPLNSALLIDGYTRVIAIATHDQEGSGHSVAGETLFGSQEGSADVLWSGAIVALEFDQFVVRAAAMLLCEQVSILVHLQFQISNIDIEGNAQEGKVLALDDQIPGGIDVGQFTLIVYGVGVGGTSIAQGGRSQWRWRQCRPCADAGIQRQSPGRGLRRG